MRAACLPLPLLSSFTVVILRPLGVSWSGNVGLAGNEVKSSSTPSVMTGSRPMLSFLVRRPIRTQHVRDYLLLALLNQLAICSLHESCCPPCSSRRASGLLFMLACVAWLRTLHGGTRRFSVATCILMSFSLRACPCSFAWPWVGRCDGFFCACP